MKKLIGLLAATAFAVSPVMAQTLPGAAGQVGVSPPQVNTIKNNDLFQDVVGGQPQARSYWASGATMLGYISGQPTHNNALVGGDSTTNLWQRGTAGVSSTSATVQWSSADRWGQWTLSSGGVKIAQDTTAADLPPAYKSAIALTHTATTAGAICMGQAIESINSYQFAGQTVELDFHAATGSGYTGGNTLTAYVTYGTGADDGLNKMAFTVNAGGATGWTGGANATAAVIPLSAVSTLGRFAAIANIPATATEVGVAFCYTPTIADTNDYVAFSGVQLVRSPQLAAYASASAGYQTDISQPLFQATSFERRPASIEAYLQYRYYYQVNEYDTVGVAQGPTGYYADTTHCQISFPLPTPMFKSPTIQNAAITTSTFTVAQTGGTPAAGAALAGTTSSGLILAVGSTPSAPFTAATASFITAAKTLDAACILLSTAAGAGNFGFTAED